MACVGWVGGLLEGRGPGFRMITHRIVLAWGSDAAPFLREVVMGINHLDRTDRVIAHRNKRNYRTPKVTGIGRNSDSFESLGCECVGAHPSNKRVVIW